MNDDLVGPILVVFDEPAASAAVFDRTVGGRVLEFERAAGGGLRLRDRETASLWDGRTGEAIAGALAGQKLASVPATQAFWFGRRDHHPGTAVYQPGAGVPDNRCVRGRSTTAVLLMRHVHPCQFVESEIRPSDFQSSKLADCVAVNEATGR